MIANTRRRSLILISVLMMVLMAQAQTQRQPEAFSVQGYPGQANIFQLQGRALVDVQDLARITHGSLSFEGGRILLLLPRADAPKPAGDNAGPSGFSRGFMRAAIEAMASIREWGGVLQVTIQNGYPVGNAMSRNTISEYQGRAGEKVALAATAASTDSDYRGLEMLRNEFNNVQVWSDRFIKARNSMNATNLTVTENALTNDEEVQNMIRCGQFLAQMFAGGTFQNDAACR